MKPSVIKTMMETKRMFVPSGTLQVVCARTKVLASDVFPSMSRRTRMYRMSNVALVRVIPHRRKRPSFHALSALRCSAALAVSNAASAASSSSRVRWVWWEEADDTDGLELLERLRTLALEDGGTEW